MRQSSENCSERNDGFFRGKNRQKKQQQTRGGTKIHWVPRFLSLFSIFVVQYSNSVLSVVSRYRGHTCRCLFCNHISIVYVRQCSDEQYNYLIANFYCDDSFE